MATQLVVDVLVNQFFIFPLDTSDFSVQRITAEAKLTHHWEVIDQIDTIEKLEAKLRYSVKDRDHSCCLP